MGRGSEVGPSGEDKESGRGLLGEIGSERLGAVGESFADSKFFSTGVVLSASQVAARGWSARGGPGVAGLGGTITPLVVEVISTDSTEGSAISSELVSSPKLGEDKEAPEESGVSWEGAPVGGTMEAVTGAGRLVAGVGVAVVLVGATKTMGSPGGGSWGSSSSARGSSSGRGLNWSSGSPLNGRSWETWKVGWILLVAGRRNSYATSPIRRITRKGP